MKSIIGNSKRKWEEVPDLTDEIIREANKAIVKPNIKSEEEKSNNDFNFYQTKESEKIYEAIKNKIGFDGDLIKFGIGDSDIYTYPNTTLGILEYLLGNKNNANKRLEAIKNTIEFDGDLVKSGIWSSDLYTHSNTTFGILEYLLGNKDNANKRLEAIKNRIEFDGDLIKYRVGNSGLYTHSNATLGILYIADKLKQESNKWKV